MQRGWARGSGQGEGGVLRVGSGSIFSKMEPLPVVSPERGAHERRDSERLARGEEEAAGCVVRQGSWPRVWAARLLKGPQTFSGGLCSYAHVT